MFYDKYLTEKGKNNMELLSEDRFSELWKYYDPYCGNFQFDLDTMLYLIDEIDEWIKENPKYQIYHQHEESYEGWDWFLTDWTE